MSSPTSEKDNSENWERIAALAGFSEDLKANREQVQINIDTKNDSDESLLPPDEELDRSETINRFSFSGNPNQRMVLAIGGAAAVVLLGLTALAFKDQKNAPPVVDADSKKESANSSQTPTNSDVGKLKTELAYLRQQQQIAQLNQQPPPPPKSPPKPKKVAPARRIATPPPPRVVYRSIPTRQLRPIERSLPPPRSPSPAPSPIVRQEDPHEAYREATALGSYGQVVALSDSHEPYMANSPTTSDVVERSTGEPMAYKSMAPKIPLFAPTPNSISREPDISIQESDPSIERYQKQISPLPGQPHGWQYAVSRQRFRPMSNPSRAIQNSSSTYSDVSFNEPSFDEPPTEGEAFEEDAASVPTDGLPSYKSDRVSYDKQELPVLEERRYTVKQIPIDSKANAQLLDSVVWDSEQIYSNDFLTIRLSEPLLDRHSEIIIPENSLLVVRAAPTPAGIVTLVAESFLVEQNGELKEIPLEPNSVTIRTDDGDPLAAERVDLSESQSDSDVGGLLVDVIGTAAGMAIGGGDNAYRDLYRFNQLEQLYERHNERENRDSFRSQRANAVWKLESGKSVEVYVSRPLTIRE